MTATTPAPAAPTAPIVMPPTRPRTRSRKRSMTLIVGLTMAGIIAAIAAISLAWLPYAPSDTSGERLEAPSGAHWLGTDKLGRDLLAQLMVGARIAIAVGVGSVAIGALIGITIGLIAAFSAPWLDDTISAALDVLIAFPVLLLAMLVVAAQGASLGTAILAIGLGLSAVIARLTRILAVQVLRAQYVTAARTSGTRWYGIIGQHVLPNIWPTLSVNLALQFGVAVLAEASLSYLGLGAPPPNASWGRLLQEAQATFATAPAGAIAPGLALVILVVGINFIADGLRDLADPTRRNAR